MSGLVTSSVLQHTQRYLLSPLKGTAGSLSEGFCNTPTTFIQLSVLHPIIDNCCTVLHDMNISNDNVKIILNLHHLHIRTYHINKDIIAEPCKAVLQVDDYVLVFALSEQESWNQHPVVCSATSWCMKAYSSSLHQSFYPTAKNNRVYWSLGGSQGRCSPT